MDAPTRTRAAATATIGLGVDLWIPGLPESRVNWGTGDLDGFLVGVFWRR